MNLAELKKLRAKISPAPWQLDGNVISSADEEYEITTVEFHSGRPQEDAWCSKCMTWGCHTNPVPPLYQDDRKLILRSPELLNQLIEVLEIFDSLNIIESRYHEGTPLVVVSPQQMAAIKKAMCS